MGVVSSNVRSCLLWLACSEQAVMLMEVSLVAQVFGIGSK